MFPPLRPTNPQMPFPPTNDPSKKASHQNPPSKPRLEPENSSFLPGKVSASPASGILLQVHGNASLPDPRLLSPSASSSVTLHGKLRRFSTVSYLTSAMKTSTRAS